jgi:hypothetical protein
MVGPTSPTNPNAPQGSVETNKTNHSTKGGYHFGKVGSHHFLGKDFTQEEWDKFWQSTIKMVNGQIQKDAEKTKKAMKKIGNSDEED